MGYFIDVGEGIQKGMAGNMIGNKIPEENKVINPVLGRAKFFGREDGRHGISNSAKHPTRTSSTKWGVMVDVKEIIPVDHKASLL